MALKTKVGSVSGSRDAPVVSVSVFDDSKATLSYDTAVAAAIAAAPTTVMGATIRTDDVGVQEQSRDCIKFDIGYKSAATTKLLRSGGLQTEAKKLHHFIAPVGVFGLGGADETSSHLSLRWKLDRQGAADEFNSGKPIAVDPLGNPRVFTYQTSQPFVTDLYLDTVEDLVDRGAFNAAPFLGRAVGELQLVSFNFTEKDYQDWELSFGLAYRATQTDLDVGEGVEVPTLRGCDYYWPIEVETYDSGSIQPKTKAVVVGQVWPLEDLTTINLPYQGTLTTRTSDTAGVVTTIYPHTITAFDDAIVFWDGGAQVADVSGVGANTVTFSGGSGDALPPLNTNLLIAKYIP